MDIKLNRNGSIDGYSSQARAMLFLMLNRTTSRPSIAHLRSHPWFNHEDRHLELLNASYQTAVESKILK